MITLVTIEWLVNAVFGLIEFIIGLRVLLKLLGANVAAPFVNWVYETSQPLLYPFEGMFPTPRLRTGSVIEFSALFALIVYALIAYAIGEILAYWTIRSH